MTNTKIKTLGFLALLIMVAIVAGSSLAASQLSQRVLLADYSLDTTAAQRAEAIRIVTEMADLAASDRGMVAASPFQTSALASVTWPILHTFRPKTSDPNSYYEKLDLAQQADAVKRQAKKFFGRQSGVPGTDILGGLLAAGELFASEPAGPRTLVLNSNMWAYSKADDLVLKARALSAPEIKRLISKLGRAGKIAKLTGVCIYVVGGGLDPRRQIPNGIQISLRGFWRAYFAKAGAVLRAWTPTLDSEPSC